MQRHFYGNNCGLLSVQGIEKKKSGLSELSLPTYIGGTEIAVEPSMEGVWPRKVQDESLS